MKLVENIKNEARDTISEHLFSVIIFLLAMIFFAIFDDRLFLSKEYGSVATVIAKYHIDTVVPVTLLGAAFSAFLCECIHLYKKEWTRIKTISFLAIMFIGISISFLDSASIFDSDINMASMELLFCVYAAYFCISIYFIYKKSGEVFETYIAKAFCGFLKGELVYGIVAIGVFLILLAVDSLIFDVFKYNILGKVEIILVGLLAFPCAIAGISHVKSDISKFGKIILGYVFTILLATAFFIIYVYIIKIIVTWTLPKNAVFSILTAMFFGGAFIWTMAQGCAVDKFKRVLEFMPFLFVPFIVLQVICLYLRISAYGFTLSRYFGLVVIIFEVLYFGTYFVRFFTKKDIMCIVLFVMAAMTFLTLVFPFINVHSVVVASQKGKIERYLNYSNLNNEQMGKDALEAYYAIRDEGGVVGAKYLEKTLTEDQIEDLYQYSGYKYYGNYTYVNLSYSLWYLDMQGYSKLYMIDVDSEGDKNKLNNFVITTITDEHIATVDISDLVYQLIENDENDVSEEEQLELLKKEITTKEGYKLIIDSIYIRANTGKNLEIESITISGYLLKN